MVWEAHDLLIKKRRPHSRNRQEEGKFLWLRLFDVQSLLNLGSYNTPIPQLMRHYRYLSDTLFPANSVAGKVPILPEEDPPDAPGVDNWWTKPRPGTGVTPWPCVDWVESLELFVLVLILLSEDVGLLYLLRCVRGSLLACWCLWLYMRDLVFPRLSLLVHVPIGPS